MEYSELVKRLADYSDSSEEEAKSLLRLFIQIIGSGLSHAERKELASQLPDQLKSLVLSAESQHMCTADDLCEVFSEENGVDKPKAKKQIIQAWQALREALSEIGISDIKSQLPKELLDEPPTPNRGIGIS